MSSSSKSPRDYSRKYKKAILEPWRQSHNLPPSPPSPPPNRELVDIVKSRVGYSGSGVGQRDKMAEGNVPALTKTDEQLVLINARLPIGKSNLLMDLQRKQKNPILLILLDILQNTNFFRAFTASANLDEQWFTLDDDLLRSALGIAPKDPAPPFVAPLDADLVIDFVNNLGYPEELQFVYKMYVNSLYQPWRTILSMINQCLTSKTSGYDRPTHLVIQMLRGMLVTGKLDIGF
ncbi:hypothetical protein Tco_0558394 [Tanacetum coccineum]